MGCVFCPKFYSFDLERLIEQVELVSKEKIEAREKLLKDMKRTKGVRFNAAKRLERSERRSTRNIAYASSLVVVITLMPKFIDMAAYFESFIALVTVGLSIFILSSSLLHSSNSGMVKADQFQRCALEVNSLRRELLAKEEEDLDLPDFARRYDEILGRYNINHETVDYDQYRLAHPDEFPDLKNEEVLTARLNVKRTIKFERAFQDAVTASAVILLVGTAVLSFLEVDFVRSFVATLVQGKP